ncbi:MAG: hypothetical protein IJG54_05095 [Bacteroidales bacterium]|nr:hypothetical protein [Bacteroidales bacterium]
MERNNEKDILQKDGMRTLPFSTPEGYFDSVEERLRERTFQKEPSAKWDAWAKALKASLALAASFLLIAGMGWGIMKLTNLKQNQTAVLAEQTEETDMMMDSLVNRFGAIEVAGIYQNSLSEDYPEDAEDNLTNEEYDALEEYITTMAPSYPGLIAEEITSNR